MTYEQQENDIVAALAANADLGNISDCMLLPDDVAEYKIPTVKKALCTVVFVGEKYDANQAIGDSSQHLTATFNISVQSRFLRGEKGVYVTCNLVKNILLGFSPSDCGQLTLTEHSFTGYQNDVWEHSVVVSCRSLRTQIDANVPHGNDITNGEDVFYDPTKITINEAIQISGSNENCGCG